LTASQEHLKIAMITSASHTLVVSHSAYSTINNNMHQVLKLKSKIKFDTVPLSPSVKLNQKCMIVLKHH